MQTHDPHFYLGLKDGTLRLYRPGAESVFAEVQKVVVPLNPTPSQGVFEIKVDPNLTFSDYRVYHPNGLLAHDPYAFLPSIGDLDLHLFGNGVHYEIYNLLGAHRILHQGVWGVRFAVWVPGVKRVSLIADFNHWNGSLNPMRSLGKSGVWEIFIPGIGLGQKYKFEIHTQNNTILVKSDPFANQMEMRPKTASVVTDVSRFAWGDATWMENRPMSLNRPISIYELHAGSWKTVLNYRELAKELVLYCKDMAYTHVEFLPLQEHPLDESWGYQVSGFYAPTSRYGDIIDFQWLINYLHNHGIGIILDWVPGHFPTDDFSLSRFNGTALYEHEDPRQGYHPHWHTYIFNFGRKEVSNFLIANAAFWFDKMHIDGLRVDAVASMLYLDYGRKEGEWIPNIYGGNENLEAIEFLKHLNSFIKEKFPGRLMIAEESTSFPKVTDSVMNGGLGFDMKWNMGWMNDTLRYFSKDSIYRNHHDNDLTFGLLYAFAEKFVLALSHDEVVHGKKSLLGKMPGDLWQKFANLRLLLSYQICQPGKKLIFMGGEIGSWEEWACKRELPWSILEYSTHRGLKQMVKELNHLYLESSALFERDFEPHGFSWICFDDKHNGVFVYLRKSNTQEFLCIHHFSSNFCPNYYLPLANVLSIQEIFNSDAKRFSGGNKINEKIEINENGITFQLPPLATLICDVKFR